MPGKRYDFLGVPVDAMTMDETLHWVEERIQKRGTPTQHTVINAAKVVLAAKDPFLRQSIAESDLVNADGQAIVWGARMLQIPLTERVTGIDLMSALIAMAAEKGYRVFFLGATQEVLDTCIAVAIAKHPKLIVAGRHNGYFTDAQAAQVAEEVRAARPDILLVAMPTPKKEKFIHEYLRAMEVPFSMGVGGSFDVLAGKVQRAPVWMQKNGLEWFYRLAQEPRRLFRRYAVTNSAFLWMLFREKLTQKKRATP